MTPAISIIIPHLRNADNDKALKVAIDCIIDNTDIDYELIVESVATRRDIYPVLNNMVHRARAEWIVFSNSDVFMAPRWASGFYDVREQNTIVTGVIVECGVIGVASVNHHLNFGVTPDTFRRAEFEAWIAGNEAADIFSGQSYHNPKGWFFPCLLNKDVFNQSSGFDSSRGSFPDEPLDMYYWDQWAASGKGFRRGNSWCYHLQNFTSEEPERINNRIRLNGT